MAQKYKLYHADAFEWLCRRKAETIHAVVTDPPFGVVEYLPEQIRKLKSGNGGIWRIPLSYDGCVRTPTPRFTVLTESDHKRIQEFHRQLAPQLFRILVPGGHVLIASQNLIQHLVIQEFIEGGFELRGEIARVVKTLRGGDRPKGAHKQYANLSVTPRCSWEPWLLFRKPCAGRVRDNLRKWKTGALRRPEKDSPFRDLIFSGVARRKEREIAPHPSLKPQSFMRQLVHAVLPLGQGVILDPFMGSGSCIAAAEALGFKSIGIERSASYFKLATKAIPKLVRFSSPDHNGHTNGNGIAAPSALLRHA